MWPTLCQTRNARLPCGSGCARLATLALAAPPPQGSRAPRRQSNLQKDFYTPEETLHLLSTPANAERIRQGLVDYSTGKLQAGELCD